MGKPHDANTTARINGPPEFARAFEVSRETLDRLQIYAELLPRWQKAVNLVAKSTLDDIWHRHFADSAQLVALAPAAATWVDLGSGGGFPGLVVAILRAETGQEGVTLIESDSRKAAFLHETARKTGIAVDIVNERIESAAIQSRIGPVEVVSARALAPLGELLGLAAPLLGPDSTCLFLKGRRVGFEMAEAERLWQFNARMLPSRTERGAQIAVIRRVEAKLEG